VPPVTVIKKAVEKNEKNKRTAVSKCGKKACWDGNISAEEFAILKNLSRLWEWKLVQETASPLKS